MLKEEHILPVLFDEQTLLWVLSKTTSELSTLLDSVCKANTLSITLILH